MNTVLSSIAGVLLGIAWLVLLVATGFNGLVVGIGLLVILSVSGSTSQRSHSTVSRTSLR